MQTDYDLLIIGGGINGCGIARDAAGRGLSVALVEMNDLASATSSSSTKLFHGGLRYLEFFEFRLVREALIERETLLKAMPHISWPMRFVLPLHQDMRFETTTPTSRLLSMVMPWMKGRRPDWLIRLGLFLYDHLGGRDILPGTSSLDLRTSAEGAPLKDKYEKAYEYSDCWVEDSRLVVLNARDAQARGATILTRNKVVKATPGQGGWTVDIENTQTGDRTTLTAKALVNAAGPWVADVMDEALDVTHQAQVRLVRGSHIVVKRQYPHDKCYFFQGTDGRITFAIPYETDFTLIGTTDAEHHDPSVKPECTPAERDYLIDFVNQYFKAPITAEDVVWTYSGVRPLYDDGASSATAATRDYVLKLNQSSGSPVLNVFGGKITTYRRLAEGALRELGAVFDGLPGNWTAGVPLPGGDFEVDGVHDLVAELSASYPFLTPRWALRLVRAYGTEAHSMLGDAASALDMGTEFGASLTEREVRWLIDTEFVTQADDVLWRRSKLGLHMSDDQIETFRTWMADQDVSCTDAAAE
ncbi:glycerol-3-phosphate dehydrogenase [Falsiphaeobacter marinintestinus]|uniref:glycerol-3-phosphate dehydrogenase n=1 Tax=Falsiphaeobacter marinintestinus TaxID=1492905 RepID=UPI0011B4684E|nr:glycerol-3-phosphate dehydrogenase [Phaeobacter marinintestinus]